MTAAPPDGAPVESPVESPAGAHPASSADGRTASPDSARAQVPGDVRAESPDCAHAVAPADRAPGALELVDVTWRPVGRRLPTIDGLSLRLEPGTTTLLAGASGSGKSTVLLALAGLLDPQAGELSGSITGPDLRPLVLQQPEDSVVASTVARDIAFGPENLALPRAEIHARIGEVHGALVPDVPLAAGTFETSGGQLQRVSLAGALALGADVLLLDEPVAMLDAESARAVRAEVAAAAPGRTLVIAEHHLGPWLDLADRLIVLGPQARIIADGPPHEVLARDAAAIEAAGLRIDADAVPAPASDVAAPAGAMPDSTRGVPAGATPAGDRDAPARTDGGPPVLVLDDVALAHPDGSGRALHEGLTLAARPGELIALTGPSGAGKTTLLRAVLGLDDVLAGTIARPAAEAIAWVPQNPEHSFVAATVREEVLASPWATDPQLGEELLESTDLAALAGASPFALSGGEQRRLAVAAALATRPSLLVLDEPTGGLDAPRRDAVLALVDAARAEGCAVLVSTHDEHLAERADQRLDLERGPAPRPARTRRRRAPSERMNQLTMLLIGLLAMIGSFAIDSPRTGLAVFVPILALAPLAIGSWRAALVRALPTALAMATVAWSVVLLSGHGITNPVGWTLGAKEALRIGALVLPGALLLGGLDAPRLGDALGQIARLPARLVVGIMAGLSQLETLRRTWRILMEARALRGLAPRWSLTPYASATVAMLVTSLRSAAVRSSAMDARGFTHAHRRTWAEPSTLGPADALGLLVGAVLLVWPWVARAWLG